MKTQRTIEDLREILFTTIEGVKDGTVSIDKAQTISDLSQVMVNSAKVEVDFAKATGNKCGSGFLEKPSQLPPGITGITRHQLR